jgi:hypothetical protein
MSQANYNFGSMLSSLEEIQQNYNVQLDPYHNTISDIICLQPMFNTCIPIRHDVVANLMRQLTDQKLSLVVQANGFTLNIVSYHGQLQYRIIGEFMSSSKILHGNYQIQSYGSSNDPDSNYQLKMTFMNNAATGQCIILDGTVNNIEKLLFKHDVPVERYIYSVVDDLNFINIFTTDIDVFITQAMVQLVFIEIMQGKLFHTYKANGQLIMRKQIEFDSIGDQKRTEIEPKHDVVSNITIIDSCGRIVREEIFNGYHPLPNTTSISKIINSLSQYKEFTNTGIVELIINEDLLIQSVRLSNITILVHNNNRFKIGYDRDSIRISAVTSLGSKMLDFDYHGNLI